LAELALAEPGRTAGRRSWPSSRLEERAPDDRSKWHVASIAGGTALAGTVVLGAVLGEPQRSRQTDEALAQSGGQTWSRAARLLRRLRQQWFAPEPPANTPSRSR
jgi:hypothetical protein